MPTNPTIMILFYGLLFGVMYFVLIRPQKKQQKKTQDMLGQLKPGDKVITIGGLHGVVDAVNKENNTVSLDCEGIYLTFEKRAISRVVSSETVATESGIIEKEEAPKDTTKE